MIHYTSIYLTVFPNANRSHFLGTKKTLAAWIATRAFQENLNLWDIAAGIIIVKEAGGIINEIDLSSLKNLKVLASSAEINTKYIEKIANF